MNPTSQPASSNLQTGARIALIGLVANILLAVAKIAAGVFGNAYVLIADGMESALDVAGSAIIWGGLKFAERPPDETHPYGHGKAEPVAAIVVAVFVLAAAIALATQSVRELFMPHHAPAPFTLIVLIIVIFVKEALYRYVIRFGRDTESTAIQTDAWHHRTDAITSIAALIGISLALIGGERWRGADNWAALFACVLIAANGVRLMRPALYEILDTAPRGEVVNAVRAAAISVQGVRDIDKCYLRKMGIRYYVDIHVGVDEDITVRSGHQIAHEVKDAIRHTDPRIADVLVHVEPAQS